MSSKQLLSTTLRRRPYICLDCRKWLAGRTLKQQRRGITQQHLRKVKSAEEEWLKRRDDIEDGRTKSILDRLEERGLLNQIVGQRDVFNDLLVQRRVGVYCGVDPTAKSLHIGHIVPFMALGWMYIHGYASTFLLGGFTANIGDPTDRLNARPEQARQEQKANTVNMFEQLKRLSKNIETYALRKGWAKEWAWRRAVVNNSEWWNKVTVNDYMRFLGKHMRVGPMLGRDSVKNRLEKGEGMSYAEFSYPLIQGWDWWELYQKGTQIQIGGADQYGNILAGAEVVKNIAQEDPEFQRKLEADNLGTMATSDPMGFTVPLLTTSSGEKFGKSAGNAIWIDRQLTSSYDLYQFFLRVADADVERYLKMLTFLSIKSIDSIMAEHKADESQRIAQHTLAMEFVELVHGEGQAAEAQLQHKQAFSKTLTVSEIQAQMDAKPFSTINSTTSGRPVALHPSLNNHAAPFDQESSYDVSIKLPRSLVVQQTLPRIMWSAGLVSSRSEGQRLINNKGAYIGGRIGKDGQPVAMGDHVTYVPASDAKWSFVEPLIVDGSLLVLRVGKWKKKFIQIVSDEDYEAAGLSCPGWKDESDTLADPAVKADLAGEEEFRKQGKDVAEEQQQRRAEARSRQHGPYGEVKSVRIGRSS